MSFVMTVLVYRRMISAMVNPCLAGAGRSGGGCGVGARATRDSSSLSLSLSRSLSLARSRSSSRSRSRSRSCSSRSALEGPGEPIRRRLYDVRMRGGGSGRAPGGFCPARLPLLVIVLGFTCSRSRRICRCGRGGRLDGG